MKKVVFLGGGRITGALVAGLRLSGFREPIIVHDRHPGKLRELKRRYRVFPEPDLHSAVAQARILIIAVRPASVSTLLDEIGPIQSPLIAVSLAAGIPLMNLRSRLGPPVRWARAMPSPVCRIGRGLTAITFDRNSTGRTRSGVKSFFARVGPVFEIPESKFDGFTVTYSCSHGYHALATLAEAGQKVGLDRKTALAAAAHALADGILAWREGTLSLKNLLHEAATPGGIAATVMSAMDKLRYREAVQDGLRAGMSRARANAKT
jgi:pyrroline-5-carboxylate reductase